MWVLENKKLQGVPTRSLCDKIGNTCNLILYLRYWLLSLKRFVLLTDEREHHSEIGEIKSFNDYTQWVLSNS